MASRTKNSLRNIFVGAINRFVSILLPFICRTLIINILGTEYLGLNSLFTSIMNVLNVTELGFGTAITASMYRPIAVGDDELVCALLNIYKKVYKIIGIIICIIGIGMIPFLNVFINDTPPKDVNIYLLFVIYILNTVCSYYFYAYKISLINAHQRADITDVVAIITKLLTGIIQIIAIVIYKSIIIYAFMNVVCILLYNIGCSIQSDRYFPKYKCKGKINDQIKAKLVKDIVALSIQKIGNTISVSLDTIVISSFLNLSIVAIYGNYNYIIGAVTIFITLIFSSIVASIGNSIALEDREKNLSDLYHFSYLNLWIIGWCSCCLICIFQSFMKIWMGPERLFPISIVIALVVCFYVSQMRKVVQTYKDAIGIWWEDKYKPLVGGIVNLVFNIILVKKMGTIGVVISTLISYLIIEFPWETHILFDKYFKTSEKNYYIKIMKMSLYNLVSVVVTYTVCNYLPEGYMGIVLKLLCCVVCYNIFMIVLSKKSESFTWAKAFMMKALKNIGITMH